MDMTLFVLKSKGIFLFSFLYLIHFNQNKAVGDMYCYINSAINS